MKTKNVSIIVPVLNEEDNIEVFYDTVSKVVKKIKGFYFSFLFIDDGSNDKTWDILNKFSRKNKNFQAVKLSRNFGSFIALFAGLETAFSRRSNDYFIMTTVDLQNPPELIPKIINKTSNGARIVFGIRTQREEGLGVVFSNIFWYLVRHLALPNMPKGGTDYCLIDRKVAGDIVFSAEKNTHIFNSIVWLGYKQEIVPYIRKKIVGRKSRWTLYKKVKLFIDTFVSFSYAPIWMVTYLGLGISTMGFTYALLIVVRKLFYNIIIEGWSSIMIAILILSGIQLVMLGVVAEYLWRTFDATRKRPMYLIDKKVNL